MEILDIREFSIPASGLRVQFGEIYGQTTSANILQREHQALLKIEALKLEVRIFVEGLILDSHTTCFGFAELHGQALEELIHQGVSIDSLYSELKAGRMPLDVLLDR